MTLTNRYFFCFIFICYLPTRICFQFKSPTVEANPLIINTLSSYTFTLYRQFTQFLGSTNWDSQAVPINADIIIQFPIQYQLSGNENCDVIMFGFDFASGYTCIIDTSLKKITIQNSIPANNQYISDFKIFLSGILNPSPVITTSPFKIMIGNDQTAENALSAVTLQPGQLQEISLTFDPAIVNSTSNLIISFKPSNDLDINSKIKVKFPSDLQWARDISTNHQIPIQGQLSCSSLSEAIQSSIKCNGLTSTQEVTLSDFNSIQIIPAGTLIIISINSLFSPPTQQSIDILSITTFTQNLQALDQSSQKITGLIAKQFSSLTITKSHTTKYVNSNIGLIFTFVLQDTLSKQDQIQMIFPAETSINYQTSITSLSLTNVIYSSSTGILSFKQNSNSQTRFAGSSFSITFIFYKTQPSTKPIQISLKILSEGFAKMKGTRQFQAQQKPYSAQITATTLKINKQSIFTINFNIADQLEPTGYFIITIPQQLSGFSDIAINIVSSNSGINTDPQIQIIGQQITIKNLNKTSQATGIPIQSINMTLSSLTLPSSVQLLSLFQIDIFYSSQGYKTAHVTQSNALQTQPGLFSQVTIYTYESGTKNIVSKVGEICDLQINCRTQNQIGIGGQIKINIGNLQVTGVIGCTIYGGSGSIINTICSFEGNIVSINLPTQLIQASQLIQIVLSNIQLPISTKQSDPLSIFSYNQNNNLIDKIQDDSLTIQMSQISILPVQPSIINSRPQNLALNTLTMTYSSASEFIYSSIELENIGNYYNYILLTIPAAFQIYLDTQFYLIEGNDQKLIQSLVNFGSITNSLGKIYTCFCFQSPQFTNNIDLSVKITNIGNPASFQPTSEGIAIFFCLSKVFPSVFPSQILELFESPEHTLVDTQIFFYAWALSANLQNTIPSQFHQLGFTFSNHQILGESELSIQYLQLNPISQYKGSTQLVGKIVIELADNLNLQMDLDSNYFLEKCQIYQDNIQIITLCSIQTTPLTISLVPATQLSIQKQIVIKLFRIYNPTTVQSFYSYSKISTFTSNSYIISQSQSDIIFTQKCNLPCKDCTQIDNQEYCKSCYNQEDNITNLIYYLQNLDQNQLQLGYGMCLDSCPSYYFAFLDSQSLICKQCQQPCIQCYESSTNCLSCDVNSPMFILHQGDCINNCPNGSYIHQSDNETVCLLCQSPCQLCTSKNQCLSCQNPYFFYPKTNQCIEICPQNVTVLNQDQNECQQCSDQCLSCSQNTDFCTSCQSNQYLYNGTCVNQCPGIQQSLIVQIEGECIPCNKMCQKCMSVPQNCISCDEGKYLHQGLCLEECPQFYYNGIQQCIVCSDKPQLNCNKCSKDGQSCIQCNNGSYTFITENNQTMCLIQIPQGYIQINGEIIKCEESCKSCSQTPNKCTECSMQLYLYLSQCVEQCPFTTISILNPSQCLECLQPCKTCFDSVQKCTSCDPGYIYNPQTFTCHNQNETNIQELCSQNYYANLTSYSCEPCIDTCGQCEFSSNNCTSCSQGYLFEFQNNGGQCLSTCPQEGWYQNQNICSPCSSVCITCQQSQFNCFSCSQNYFIRDSTHQCLSQCPQKITIADSQNMKCLQCVQGCLQCQSSVSQCVLCANDYYSFQEGNSKQCLKSCPSSYYGSTSSKECQSCPSQCSQCDSPQSCSKCSKDFSLHNAQCVSTCPTQFFSSQNLCIKCSEQIQNCFKCSLKNQLICEECISQIIVLIEGKCYSQCPENYIQQQTQDNSLRCITIDEYTDQVLDNSLTAGSIFPMPFTCIGLGLFIAVFMSKLQNKNTYVIGATYSFLGILQTVSLGYLIKQYYDESQPIETRRLMQQDYLRYEQDKMMLLLVGVGIIYGINILGVIAQTPILLADQKFRNWNKNITNKIIFGIVSFLSFAINYKFKLILFSKLFSFGWARSKLQTVQKFRIFNILSFLGAAHQIFIIYICVVMLFSITDFQGTFNPFGTPIFLTFIDAVMICVISLGFSMASNKKQQQFFEQIEDNGYVLNRKIKVGQQDLSKEAIKPRFLIGQENRLNQDNMQSHDIIDPDNQAEMSYEDQEISLSISDNRSEHKNEFNTKIEKQIKHLNQNNLNKSKLSYLTKRSNKQIMNQNKINQESSKPINNHTLRGQTSSQQKSQDDEIHSIGKSMVYEKNQQQLIKKNKTTLFDSPSKSNTKMQQIQDNHKQIENNKIESSFDKKSAQTKVYSRKRKPSRQNVDQLQQIIKNKQAQLMGLRRQSSKKDLKNRQNQGENKGENQGDNKGDNQRIQKQQVCNDKERQQKQKQLENGDTKKTAKKVKQNIFDDYEQDMQQQEKQQQFIKNKSQKIRQNSTLINLIQKQQRQNHQQLDKNVEIQESINIAQSEYKNSHHQQNSNKIINNNSSLHTYKSKQQQIVPLTHSQQNIQQQIVYTNNIQEHKKEQPIKQDYLDNFSTLKADNQKKLNSASHQQQNNNHYQQKTVKNSKKIPQNMFDSMLQQSIAPNNPSLKASFKQETIQLNISQSKNLTQHQKTQAKKYNEKQEMFQLEQELQKQLQDDQQKQQKIYQNQEEQIQDSGLQDSRPENDQQINHRPLQSSFIKSQRSRASIDNQKDTGLIEILQKNTKHHIIDTKNGRKSNKVPPQEDRSQSDIKSFSRFTSQDQTVRLRSDLPPMQKNMRPSTTDKSRMYMAGMRQLEETNLTKKNSQGNHPLGKSRQKQGKKIEGLSDQSQEMIPYYQNANQGKDRKNKSLYNVKMKKQPSYTMSNQDQIQFISAYGSNQTYLHNQQLLNRYGQGKSRIQSSTINPDLVNMPPQKPIVSQTARNNMPRNRNLQTSYQRNRNNFNPNQTMGNRILKQGGDDDDLKQYYGSRVGKNTSNQSIEKSPKGSKKSRSGSRDNNKDSTKRMKSLEKIYLQRLEAPKRK